MVPDKSWFTEVCDEGGTAFSLKVEERVHEEQSAYQKIEIYRTAKFGYLMVIDGFVMLSSRDNFLYHEMMSHPALFTHPDPRRVAIIGGGDCGTLREVLRHPGVETATQIEIDERVTRVSERYFPELCEANDDPRATLLFADGIRWMQEAADGALDVVIIDSTDPIGPAEGLFQAPFYRDCFRVLGEAGVLVQQTASPLFHQRLIRQVHAALREVGFHDVRALQFPQCVYPSGWWTATIATKKGDVEEFRSEAAAERNFATRYYNEEIHRAALAQPQFMIDGAAV
ncbi:MAG: polyamine aminopropyltransferase [Gammaproteobacteria bacterium]